jgi:ABC-type uncharacterized transport system permease subunit
MTLACQILSLVAAAGYLAAFLCGLPTVFGRGEACGKGAASRLAALVMMGAFLCQTVTMVLRGVSLGRCPIDGPADLMQVIAWSLVVLYAIVGTAFRTSILGLFTSALAAIISVVALRMDGAVSFGAVPAGILVHAWLSLFSYGAFALLALTSFMYLLQLYGLRKNRWTAVFRRLPSLRELDGVNFRLLLLGTLVYTVALSIGAWWYLSGFPVELPKVLFPGLLWGGYATTLALRFTKVLFGRRLAAMCLVLFVLAIGALYPVAERHTGANRATEEIR